MTDYTSLSVCRDLESDDTASSILCCEFDHESDLICEYFYGGYTNLEIAAILRLKNNVQISQRHIRRILKNIGLTRRNANNHQQAIQAIRFELQGSGRSLGYRAMTKRLLSKYGLRVPRDRVAEHLQLLDPEGVAGRRSRRLSRRVYYNKGPNYLLHIDGYDKLKPFGFAIHGGICGFSRRILWLKVSRTNNDPKVVAGYFVQYMKEIKGVPRCVRSDRGTENSLIKDIQQAFRCFHGDDMAGEHSFLMGSSPSNQRIERWWLSNKQGGCQFWIDFFKDLEAMCIISTSNDLQKECLRFCFMQLIQKELDQIRIDWNQHRVRESRGAESPGGKPDLMFFTPELYGTRDYKYEADNADIDEATLFCDFLSPNGCNEDFESQCASLMEINNKRMPEDNNSALELYQWLNINLN